MNFWALLVNKLPKQRMNRTHFRGEMYKERIGIKIGMVGGTHEHAVSWFMNRTHFCTLRDPTLPFKVSPLCSESALRQWKGDSGSGRTLTHSCWFRYDVATVDYAISTDDTARLSQEGVPLLQYCVK